MKLVPLALALTLTAPAFSQATFTDPANLRGERVRAHDGRELPVDQGASGLQQLLRRLNTRASILNIVAHPDDEDGGMLAFYSRGLGARVADLSLTRGEGGQNAMTGDFEDALGLLRTQELLSSDRYPGIDQFFGTEVDFGFSKTKEEAFAKWTHDRVLYDAVRAIRLYRPLVITATFIGGVTDGHGQHQVSGQIAQEAFKAAADPKVFPEMIAEGLLPWQALKVYARVPMQSISPKGLFDYATGQYAPAKFTNYVTGEVTTTQPSIDVVVHEGTPDALLGGKSYVQFARIGLGLQRSQIGGNMRLPPAGAFDVSYHLYGSRLSPSSNLSSRPDPKGAKRVEGAAERPAPRPTPANSLPLSAPNLDPGFFDGIDISINGIASLAPHLPMSLRAGLGDLSGSIGRISAIFEATHSPNSQQNKLTTDALASSLADALKRADALIAGCETAPLPPEEKANILHELRVKRVQLNDALVLSLGLSFDATLTSTADGNVVHPIQSPAPVMTHLTQSTAAPVAASREWLENVVGPWDGRIDRTEPSPWTLTGPLPVDRSLNYYRSISFNNHMTRPYFHRDNIEQPWYDLINPGYRNSPFGPPALSAWAAVTFNGVEVELGRVVHDGPQPISYVPKFNIALSSHAQVLPEGQRTFSLTLTNHSLGKAIGAGLDVPSGWVVESEASDPKLRSSRYVVTVPDHPLTGSVVLRTSVTIPNSGEDRAIIRDTEGYRPIGYGDLPRTNYFTPATDRIVPVDLKLPTRSKIAYLPGTGDDVPSALVSIGLVPKILTIADLTASSLAQYDTVILGVRTYNAHPDLHGAPTQALFDYARNGGNVVVQYQTTEFTAADAPYPLSLGSNEKVVDETAPVQLLEATNPLLTTPNRITPADFNNWVEERGHGFLSTWDSHYTALTETHDPGGPETQPQAPQRGGLITTPLGKGRWTYCAFALYRQLPEAVPGAYRLFVNLLNP